MMLSTFQTIQLSPTFTQRVIRQIRNLQPTPLPHGKPLVPWIATTLVVIATFIGFGQQQMAQFQRPYSLDALDSATMVEIVDAPMIETPMPKPMLANRGGASNSREAGDGNLPAGNALGAAQDSRNEAQSKEKAWTQTNGPYGGTVTALHATPDRTLFAGTPGMGIFRSTDGGDSWQPASRGLGVYGGSLPGINVFAQKGSTLYAGTTGDLFSSSDGGNSWQQLTQFQLNTGNVSGIAIIGKTLYIGIRSEKSVSFSDDNGKSWTPMGNGLTGRDMQSIVSSGTTLFAKIGRRVFYRRGGEDWWSELPSASEIYTLAASGETVYATTMLDNRLLRSTDAGESWESIQLSQIQLISRLHVTEGVIYANSQGMTFRSADGGETWEPIKTQFTPSTISAMATVSKNQLYIATDNGVLRSTDGGNLWESVNRGLVSTNVAHLTVFKNTLYAGTEYDILKSTDGGRSWKPIHRGLDTTEGVILAVSGNAFFVAVDDNNIETLFESTSTLFGLSDDGEAWIPVQRMQSAKNSMYSVDELAISGGTFYTIGLVLNSGNSGRRLFRWKKGEKLWTDLGLDLGSMKSTLAVSERTVYVGRNNGGLLRSLDEGVSWVDVSQNLPDWEGQPTQRLRNGGYDLTFVGGTIYAGASDGIFRSTDNGDTWAMVNAGLKNANIRNLIAQSTTLYGTNYYGVFRLKAEADRWEHVASVPRYVQSLAVNGTTLYAGTQDAGVFRISLEE